ncbi:UvrD-helicase domain-containing protein [Klebsiella michiganensis]|uniref:UvrD-helicase domain-containing protein n=1 Tax=Klebsiella michiganensis TaxID=1134687 RepID=UPI003BF34CE9
MTWKTTPEQNAIIEWKGNQLVVNAFAGTCKTTLMQFAQAYPDSKMLYLAYNRAIRDEAEQKFPFNVECKTSHQRVWSHFGRHFRHRLMANLGITDVTRKLNTRHWPLTGLNAFLCSAEPEPSIIHLLADDERHDPSADKILWAVKVLWYEVSRTESDFPITHDVYPKLFQLSGLSLASKWDTILFDEVQDANPVTCAFVLSQLCRIVLVGDRYQQIYCFRGADNALSSLRLEQVERLWLTTSFRFGPAVPQMANMLLATSGEEMKITGSCGDDEVVTYLPAGIPHYSVLSRTVSGVIGAALSARLQEKKVFWVGGIEGYKTDELEDLCWFSADMHERMQSPRLGQDYRDFEKYCSIAKATQEMEMNQAIRLLDEYFSLPQKLAIMRRQVVTHEKDPQVTVSTAHRSKGLGWEVVVQNENFCDITDPLPSAEERQDETNLLYVAVTRARKTLVLNELMQCLKSGEEQKDCEQPATDDVQKDGGDAIFPC